MKSRCTEQQMVEVPREADWTTVAKKHKVSESTRISTFRIMGKIPRYGMKAEEMRTLLCRRFQCEALLQNPEFHCVFALVSRGNSPTSSVLNAKS